MNQNIKPGDRVVCVDDDWTHLGEVLVDRYPHKGGEFTVAGLHQVGDDHYFILAEQDIDPGFYGVDAFLLKDASASPQRELAPA